MLQRSAAWNWPALGLFYTTTAYNTYVASLPSYVAQLDPYPDSFREFEDKVLRKAAAGPYRWAMPEDLFRLRDHYGQQANFRDLRTTAIAAKVRVTVFENMLHGGLQISSRASRLRSLIQGSDRIIQDPTWSDWLQANPLFVLQRTRQETVNQGLHPRVIMEQIAGSAERPWSQAVLKRIRRRFQSTLADKLRQKTAYDPQRRMENKLRRFHLPGPPAIIATRVLRRMVRLRTLIPPRVSAAVLSTLWNRWATKRRVEQRWGPCTLRCSPTAADSLEHYAHCPVIRQAAIEHLNLRLRGWPYGLTDFMMATGPLSAPHPSESILVRTALLVYATYMVTNAARHQSPADSAESAAMMHQAIIESTRGHERCQTIVRDRFLAPPPPRARAKARVNAS
jgi:hypothetical protein